MSTAIELARPSHSPIFSFAPTNFEQAIKFAEILSGSDIVPKQYKGKPGDILVAMQYGAEVGLQPLQALNSIAVINGRPGLYGDGFLAVILSQPDFMDVEEMDLPEIVAKGFATCTVKRRGRKPVTRTFTLEMAKTAGLLVKDGPWKQYQPRQLQMRARGFAGRDAYADVLRGIKSVEELLDYSDAPLLEGTSTATATPVDEVITQDDARAFGDAWKKAGWNIDQAKAHLLKEYGLQSSLKLKRSQYTQAMQWATKNPQWAPTANGKPADPPASDEKAPREKEICFELFRILGYNDVKQAEAIQAHSAAHVTDWSKLANDLNKELPVD